MSPNAEPTPPAMNPPMGPRIIPLVITKVSPRLRYPKVDGNGITKAAVTTAVRAARIATRAMKIVGFLLTRSVVSSSVGVSSVSESKDSAFTFKTPTKSWGHH